MTNTHPLLLDTSGIYMYTDGWIFHTAHKCNIHIFHECNNVFITHNIETNSAMLCMTWINVGRISLIV